MAYVAASTLTTGDMVTAGEWNASVVANSAALRTGSIAIASQGANELIFASSGTQLARNSALTYNASTNSLSVGASPLDYIANYFAGNFTSGGAASNAAKQWYAGTLTGVAGDTSSLGGTIFGNAITTQASQAVTTVYQVKIDEPTIIVGGGGSAGTSASLWITGAAGEASANYALFVDDGATRLDGTLDVDGITTITNTASGATPGDTNTRLIVEHNDNCAVGIYSGTGGAGIIDFGDSGDSDIGRLIYNHSSNFMSFTTNAAERMRIDNAGNVGLGVTDPDVALDVTGGDNVLDIFRITQRASGAAAYGLQVGLADTGDPVFQRLVNDTATESFRIVRGTGVVKFNANVGIGTSTPTSPSDVARILEIEDGTHAGLVLHDSTADAWEMYANGTDVSFAYNNSIKMRIEGDTGYVGIGTTEITQPLTVSAGGGQGIKVDTSPGTSGAAGATGGSAFLTLGSHTGTTNNNNTDNGINFMVDNVTKWSWGMKGQGSTDSTADMNLFNNVHDNVCIKVFGASNTVNFIDAVNVAGTLSKVSGTFKIDHPLPSMTDTHHLIHSFIEGPKADLIYRGTATLVDGHATVDLDESAGMTSGTWILLCRDEQCYTSNETGWKHVRGSVTGSTLTIDCEESDCTDTVSWMVVACRQDDHMKSSHTLWTDDEGYPIIEPLKPEPDPEPEPAPAPEPEP